MNPSGDSDAGQLNETSTLSGNGETLQQEDAVDRQKMSELLQQNAVLRKNISKLKTKIVYVGNVIAVSEKIEQRLSKQKPKHLFCVFFSINRTYRENKGMRTEDGTTSRSDTRNGELETKHGTWKGLCPEHLRTLTDSLNSPCINKQQVNRKNCKCHSDLLHFLMCTHSEHRILELEKENASLRQENQTLTEEIEETQQEKIILVEQESQKNEELSTRIKQLEEELKNTPHTNITVSSLAELSAVISRQQISHDQKSQLVLKLESEKTALLSSRQTAEHSLAGAQKRVASLEKEIDLLKQRIEQKDKDLVAVAMSAKQITSMSISAHSQPQSSQSSHSSSVIRTVENDNTLIATLETLRQENTKLTRRVANLKANERILRHQLLSISSLTTQIQQFCVQNDRVKRKQPVQAPVTIETVIEGTSETNTPAPNLPSLPPTSQSLEPPPIIPLAAPLSSVKRKRKDETLIEPLRKKKKKIVAEEQTPKVSEIHPTNEPTSFAPQLSEPIMCTSSPLHRPVGTQKLQNNNAKVIQELPSPAAGEQQKTIESKKSVALDTTQFHDENIETYTRRMFIGIMDYVDKHCLLHDKLERELQKYTTILWTSFNSSNIRSIINLICDMLVEYATRRDPYLHYLFELIIMVQLTAPNNLGVYEKLVNHANQGLFSSNGFEPKFRTLL